MGDGGAKNKMQGTQVVITSLLSGWGRLGEDGEGNDWGGQGGGGSLGLGWKLGWQP